MTEFRSPSPAELAILASLAGPVQSVARHRTIRREGDRPQSVYMLVEGWVLSSITLADGSRQILKVHLPGDILGAPSIALDRAAETLTALTPTRLRTIGLSALGGLFTRAPHLAALLFLSAQQERVILMDRLCSIGRTSAECRLAAFLVHLHDRLKLITPDVGARFDHPLTQEQIGDIIGLTAVHVNRVFRALEDRKLILREGHGIELLDMAALRKLSGVPARTLAQDLSWLPKPLD
ncbi:Crp/Fnr family transcriptional regulator [Sphingobium herbicidovorans]|uniref:Crp/Fnr family transcriptional regulator n=1 Tax=Sphingobium herbicidovorans TaxID=76947 RepID=UPI001E3FBD71|nr:Crp/Fnr family transcriptional regulator [Sphingobium herbicidovorans]